MTIAQPSGEHKCPSWSDCGPSLRLSSKTLLAPCGSSLSPQTSSASHHLPMLPEKCQTASDHSQLASTSGCGAVSSLSSDADRLCLCKTRCATKRCPCKNKDRVCSKYCHPQRSCCNKTFTKKCEVINISDDCDTKQKAILWTIIDDIHLYDSDKMILESREWLNDRLIHAAQQLLLSKFPHISGLQSPILQCTRTFEIHREKEFIQCLNQGGNHWIMVSSIGCSRNTVIA